MITVGYLKKVLENIDDNALVYAYEGEIVGIVIVSGEETVYPGGWVDREEIAVIRASETEEIQDNKQ